MKDKQVDKKKNGCGCGAIKSDMTNRVTKAVIKLPKKLEFNPNKEEQKNSKINKFFK